MARFQPALLGGLFIGVLSSLPVIGIANCCCLWVILGGMLTVYLEQQAIESALSNIPNLPPETADWVRSLTQGPGVMLVSMIVTVPLYAVFGLLGALLGLAFFRKKVTPDTTMGPPA